MGLTKEKIELLRKFVDNICELKNDTTECEGELIPHRIRRGWQGGTYEHRNIKMICNKHHKMLHANEFTKSRSR